MMGNDKQQILKHIGLNSSFNNSQLHMIPVPRVATRLKLLSHTSEINTDLTSVSTIANIPFYGTISALPSSPIGSLQA